MNPHETDPACTSWEPNSLNRNPCGEHSHKLKILHKFNPQPSQPSTYLSDDTPETTATGPPLPDIFGCQNESNWLFHHVTKMFLTLSKRIWKFQGACGPEQLRVVNWIAGESLIVHNFLNTHFRRVWCIYSLSVHGNEQPSCFFDEIFRCGAQLKIDHFSWAPKWSMFWCLMFWQQIWCWPSCCFLPKFSILFGWK